MTRSKSPIFIWLKWGCALSILSVCVLLLAAFWYYNNSGPKPLPPFPAYPNALELKFTSPLPEQSDLLYAVCETTFSTEKYQAFATTDSESQVLAFYRQAAAKMGKQGLEEMKGYGSSRLKSSPTVTCFTEASYHKIWPTNVIFLLNPNNVGYEEIIAETFSNAPDKMLVILVLQGDINHI